MMRRPAGPTRSGRSGMPRKERGKERKGRERKGAIEDLVLKRMGCAKTTPDGRAVCFKFNNPFEGCKNQQCSFAHVCGRCFKADVPMHRCDHKSS